MFKKPSMSRYWDAVSIPPAGWSGDNYFATSDKHNIRYGFAPACAGNGDIVPAQESKGAVVIAHGYGENIDLYYETMKKFQRRGYAVYAMDFHGQGRSGRLFPHRPRTPSTEGMMRHVDDMDIFVNDIIKPNLDDDKPLIMSCNSMGGHIGMLYMHEYPDVFDGAVMSAPMYDVKFLNMPRILKPAIRFAFNVASLVGFRNTHLAESWSNIEHLEKSTKIIPPDLCADPENIRKELISYMNRTYYDKGLDVPTVGWIASTFKTTKKIMNKNFLQGINVPVLIGSAGDESFVENESHGYVHNSIEDSERVIIKNANHTLWLESDQNLAVWWGYIDAFLERIHSHFDYKNGWLNDQDLPLDSVNDNKPSSPRP